MTPDDFDSAPPPTAGRRRGRGFKALPSRGRPAPQVLVATIIAALEADYSPSSLSRRVGDGSLVVAIGDEGSLVGFAYTEHNWLYDAYMGDVTVWMAQCVPTPNEDPDCVPGPEFGLCLLCDAKHAPVCTTQE